MSEEPSVDRTGTEEAADQAASDLPTPHVESRYPIEPLHQALADGQSHLGTMGATGSLRACLLADLSRRLARPLVVLCAEPADARQLADDLSLFAAGELDEEAGVVDQVVHYPDFDVGPYHNASPDRKLTLERMATLSGLVRAEPPRYLVAPVRAALRKTIPVAAMRRLSRELSVGDEVDNAELRQFLTDCGYTEVPVVEDPGTFAIRGDIVDVYTPAEDVALRLERWGDEISEIRAFDPQSQRTIEERESAYVFPVRQEILDDEAVRHARRRLHELADELTIPSRRIREILDDLEAGLHFIGIDALLPALHTTTSDLLEYVPDDALVVVVDPDGVASGAQAVFADRQAEMERSREADEIVFEPAAYYRTPGSAVGWITARDQRLEMRRVAISHPADDELVLRLPPDELTFEFRARPNTDVVQLRKKKRGAEQTVRALGPMIAQWRERYGRICIACRTAGQVDRLVGLLESFGVDAIDLPPPIDVTEPVPPPAGVIEVYRGTLSEGFRSEHLSLALVSGEEIFGRRVATYTNRSVTEHASISHFRDLSKGDHVVHVDFGIGRYLGLIHLDVGGVGNDFLHLEYADGDKLYIPVYRLGRVQKYIGQTDGIRLDKLGGTSWERTKERVKEEIRAVAGDLLKLYAQREMAKGYQYTAPDDYYREFEAAFPFEETPDQQRAIEQVLDDMTGKRPMDRLICGDVGFGKTEVAMRAAMKAVVDGKQVAVLVPTTILCEQHRLTFRERCGPFGARVEAVSRFRTAKETREILADTAAGEVDILIGTHRLLSGDIDFQDLGILIVDEEQRFGVKHKEKIKQLRANIDVLALSATPIPRTLQMSLLGIRDLSIIATPPHERLAVRTHVAKFSDSVIREAIMRELSRGGQVFFVHNRVQTIEEMAHHIGETIPEARIAIGHGQMPEKQLEDVMLRYIEGDVNVLVCSAIIESGLDIPNANTIVVNRADLFGLSQLYQLRGRVGRGKQRAYAYLLIPRRRTLPKDSQARLEVIQTHTELGSGFQVATYDLEIRGAGNLLGEDQSGHVAAVGLDLYTELLEETINELRDIEGTEAFEPEVNIPVEAFIPSDYIEATSLRLMFYKRFSLSQTREELFDIYSELDDRFGTPPEAVRNLRDVVSVKIACRMLRARKLDCGPSAISIELDESTPLDPRRIVDMVRDTRGRLRLTEQMKLIYSLKPDESARPMATARWFVDELLALMLE